MFSKLALFVDYFVSHTSYYGFFFLMVLESTSVPIILPAEVVLLTAGYSVGAGKLNFYFTLFACVFGSLCGAFINYFLAYFFGRNLLDKYGKYFLLNKSKLKKFEEVFNEYGAIITFLGRLIPFVKHIVSIPPGLSKMNIFKFAFYTSLGSLLLSWVVIYAGMKVGENSDHMDQIMPYIKIGIFAFVILAFVTYYIYNSVANSTVQKRIDANHMEKADLEGKNL